MSNKQSVHGTWSKRWIGFVWKWGVPTIHGLKVRVPFIFLWPYYLFMISLSYITQNSHCPSMHSLPLSLQHPQEPLYNWCLRSIGSQMPILLSITVDPLVSNMSGLGSYMVNPMINHPKVMKIGGISSIISTNLAPKTVVGKVLKKKCLASNTVYIDGESAHHIEVNNSSILWRAHSSAQRL